MLARNVWSGTSKRMTNEFRGGACGEHLRVWKVGGGVRAQLRASNPDPDSHSHSSSDMKFPGETFYAIPNVLTNNVYFFYFFFRKRTHGVQQRKCPETALFIYLFI